MTAPGAHLPERSPRVLLIGIDGVRTDIINDLALPHLDGLRAQGGFRELRIDDEDISISGPMWSTILTGQSRNTHGVHNNDNAPTTRLPDIFTQLLTEQLISMPVAAASWPPLTSRTGYGPVIDPRHVRCYTEPLVNEDIAEYEVGDKNVMHAAIRFLGIPTVDAAFVYFGIVDEVGHAHGVGPEYKNVLQHVDSQIGEVLRALNERADRDRWIVMVTTDHGQTDHGNHGGDSIHECSVWVLSNSIAALEGIQQPADISTAIARIYIDQ